MLLYICIAIALMVALSISVTDSGGNLEIKKSQKFYFSTPICRFLFILLIFAFWFLTAFRGKFIGNDTVAYIGYYKNIGIYGVNTKNQIELGYQYFCQFLSMIDPDPQFLLIVVATICYACTGICILKKSDNILYSVLLLFCLVFSFFASGIRQSISMSIVLVAYLLMKERKVVIPIILIIIAAQFHVSALMVFLWFAHRLVPKKPFVVVSVALAIAILSATGLLNNVLITLISEYEEYFESQNAGTGWLGIAYYALRALVFYAFFYSVYRGNQKDNSLVLSNSVLLLFTVCLGFSVNLFERASLYFVLPTVIDMPNAFNSGKIKLRNFWMVGMGVVMVAYFVVTLILRPEWNNLYPYEFYWS